MAARTRLSMASVYNVRRTPVILIRPRKSPGSPDASRGLCETCQISVNFAEIDRLGGIRRRRRSDPRGSSGFRTPYAIDAEVLRDPLDHRQIDPRCPRDVPFEERVVAERVDEARSTAREPVYGLHRFAGERHAGGACEPQAVLDVGLGALGIEMLEPELHRDALRQRRIEAQVLLDVRPTREDKREEAGPGDLQGEEGAGRLPQLSCGQHTR